MRILAVFSLALSAAVFAANYILPVNALLYLAAVSILLAAGLLLTRRKWLRGTVLVLAGFAIGLSAFYVKYSFTVKPCRLLDNQTLEISAVILDYPVEYDYYSRIPVRLNGDNTPHVKAYLYDGDNALSDAAPGDTFVCTAKLKSADIRFGKEYDGYNAGDIFLTGSIKSVSSTDSTRLSIAAIPAGVRKAVSDRIDTLYSPDTAAFLRSITLGDKSALYEYRAVHFDLSDAGIMHIAAVSGMHIAFLVGFLQLLLGKGGRSSIICIVLVWCFVALVGATPSAVRAGFMQTLLLLAPILRRENDTLTSLSAVLAIVLVKNPYAAANISLQLSFGAMAGIMCFGEKIYDTLTAKTDKRTLKIIGWIFAAVSSSLAVMLFTLPLTTLYFGYVPVLSPIANILSLWAVSWSFCGTFVSIFLSFVPILAKAAAFAVSLLVKYIFAVVGIIASVPFCTVYLTETAVKLWLLSSYIIIALFAFSKLAGRTKLVCSLAGVLLLLFAVYGVTYASYRRDICSFAVIDVGQGQSIAVMSGESTVIVDCGGASKETGAGNIASAYLLSRGRMKIDALVLTHLHSDHTNGVLDLMHRVRTDRIYLPKDAPDSENTLEKIRAFAENAGIELVFIEDDTDVSAGDIVIELFAPGKAGGANERCMMCRIGAFGNDMLITADAPITAEEELVQFHELSGTDYLIAGHHGSRKSTGGALLEAVGADTAIISVGYNTYGHPTNEILARLVSYGYNVYRTDINGTVEIRVR